VNQVREMFWLAMTLVVLSFFAGIIFGWDIRKEFEK